MTWIWRYRVQLFLRNSIWVLPSVGMVAALVAIRVVHRAEIALGWQSDLPPEAAQTVLTTLASSMFTFIVFVSSTMLVAFQLASAQLTPRIIALIFRDPVTKLSSTLFAFTFTFLIGAVVRTHATLLPLTTYLAAYSCVASLCVFFYLIDHVGKLLRPNEALRSVALQGRKVIESVYPRKLTQCSGDPPEPAKPADGDPIAMIPSQVDGVLLACDIPGIVLLAEQAGCILELVPQVGDFVAEGSPLFRAFGESTGLPQNRLYRMIAIGHERTMEQDPAFVFRIIVDIASKALSPAINDPTTAVLAIDQLHHLLRTVGQRYLDDERIRDATGQVRLVYRTPGWEDFVQLAVTEIRHFGCESIQVARRLRAMLEDLIHTLPEDRLPLLRQELDLLRRSAARFFPDPEDRALAAVSDRQGVGGRTEDDVGTRGLRQIT
ncbi:MAG: DUF2254 domain-containing protein [Bacillota bacterium]